MTVLLASEPLVELLESPRIIDARYGVFFRLHPASIPSMLTGVKGIAIFCQIVSGAQPCHRVYEDDSVLAFMDIYPATRGHTLLIPKEHFESVFDITGAAIQAVSDTARRNAIAIAKLVEPDGMSIVQANGAAAGQTVMHYHLHLLPRAQGQKLRLHGPRQAPAEELAKVAAAIAELL